MTSKRFIIEGTPEWESICEQCGLCCLIKYIDNLGNIYMTNVRCAALDKDTHKCKCYASEMTNRDNGCNNCIALGGMRVTHETLNNEYPVPSFCPYVQKFCTNKNSKKPKTRPNINWQEIISETELQTNDDLQNHIIPKTNKYFKYNPHVNKRNHRDLIHSQHSAKQH